MSLPTKLNINYMDQITYLQGFHRSGWPFVLRQLVKLQNDNGIWCDTYVDRTFHWAKPSVIPYTRPWVGFVHHTFDTKFSDFNNVNLLKNEQFLSSLDECKGLFVFSNVQKKKWDGKLKQLGFDIPVVSLVHPTQFVDTMFTMDKFYKNVNKKVVQVGAWLRDTYAIYALNNGVGNIRLLNSNSETLTKTALVGPQMQNYFKPLDFYRILRRPQWKHSEAVPSTALYSSSKLLTSDGTATSDNNTQQSFRTVNPFVPTGVIAEYAYSNGSESDSDGMCRDIVCRDADYGLNKYVYGAINLLKSFDESVLLLPTLDDSSYDTLLSENIVFIKLVDAAAVNTLIECVVRNTPIIINRLPAVEEILGTNYPLYFDDLSQVPSLIDANIIQKAYNQLSSMDKTSLTSDYFIQSIVNSPIYKNL
jgi:hypothetical protein